MRRQREIISPVPGRLLLDLQVNCWKEAGHLEPQGDSAHAGEHIDDNWTIRNEVR